MYIAYFFKKEVAGSPSEVCKVERKKVFFQNLIPARAELKKKNHLASGSETKLFFTSVLFLSIPENIHLYLGLRLYRTRIKYWTPVLAEVSYEFGSFYPSICLLVFPFAMQDPRNSSSFFL